MSNFFRRLWLVGCFCVVSGLSSTMAHAGEPGYAGQVVLAGPDREAKNRTDILQRPYRPLHFYGNTVRRVHYRGQLLPRSRDFRSFAMAR